MLDELETALAEKGNEPTYLTPWVPLTKILGGAEDGDVIGLLAEGKMGKMQGLSAKVLTPTGWTTMGALTEGALVASIDGEPSKVTAIVEHGVKALFKITFSDGRSTRCGAEHLWKVGSVTNFRRNGYRVVDTATLACMAQRSGEWFIPLFNGEFGEYGELPMEPWLLGALLGDGGFSNNFSFTKTDPCVIARVRAGLDEEDCELVTRRADSGKDYNIVGTTRGVNPAKQSTCRRRQYQRGIHV